MNCEQIFIGSDGAVLTTYFPDASPEIKNSDRHPAIVICPGGAYEFCSDREAEPIALMYAAHGISACVLRYPCAPDNVRFPAQLSALAQAVAWVRKHAAENAVDPDRIAVTGFSAGGHLAASLGVFWNEPFLAEETGLSPEQMRPDKMVLCYPVITAGEFCHDGSIRNLLGEDAAADDDIRGSVSLEEQVSADVPPTFLWHTVTDNAVPVENSLMFACALRRAGVPFEAHFYSQGAHGLSLANHLTESPAGGGVEECCTGWPELAVSWLLRE